MSFYELDRPRPAVSGGFWTTLESFVQRALGGLASVNESRLKSVLYRLDDAQLARIGITRAQIPAHARKCMMSGR